MPNSDFINGVSYDTATNQRDYDYSWAVPTYEAPKTKGSKGTTLDADAIGAAIAKHLIAAGAEIGGGEITVEVPVVIDGREIGNVVAKQIKVNSDLQSSIRRVN
jgi:hypothetical protein